MTNEIAKDVLKETPTVSKTYNKGSYNKYDHKEQWIRISDGCPNKCPYCRESFENGVVPIYYPIPDIVRNDVKIIDMNLLYKPRVKEILKELGSKRPNNKVVYYELVCGVDYRYIDEEMAKLLKENRFINIRLAWDWELTRQRDIKKVVEYLIKAGYKSNDITVFMICNWKIKYEDCLQKLDLCKVWRVKVADCYFDNQLMPNVKPIFWTTKQIEDFRHRCRKHNQIVNFGIDPELKPYDNKQSKLIEVMKYE
jgi:hypothetical protein